MPYPYQYSSSMNKILVTTHETRQTKHFDRYLGFCQCYWCEKLPYALTRKEDSDARSEERKSERDREQES